MTIVQPSRARSLLIARALTLGLAMTILTLMGNRLLNWGQWDLPRQALVSAFPCLLAVCLWQVLRAPAPVAVVPFAHRVRLTLGGLAGLAVATGICRLVIDAQAGPSVFVSEEFVASRTALACEFPGTLAFGALVTLMAPSSLLAREEAQPVRAILSWATLPLIPLIACWAPLNAFMTHVPDPEGWGRLVLLAACFGVGWATASRAILPEVYMVSHRHPALDAAFVVVTTAVALVGAFFVGFHVDTRTSHVGLFAYAVLVLSVLLLIVHWRAPRSASDAVEVGRAVLLSLPVLVLLAAGAWLAWALGATRTWIRPDFLLLPLPVAVAGALWVAGTLGLVLLRLRRAGEPAPA